MEKRHKLVDNTDEKRYEFDLGDDMAIIEYLTGDGVIALTHTEVPPQYEGQGIGSGLVKAVLDDIRRKQLQVVPQCQFVGTYIRRHPEYTDLVATEEIG